MRVQTIGKNDNKIDDIRDGWLVGKKDITTFPGIE